MIAHSAFHACQKKLSTQNRTLFPKLYPVRSSLRSSHLLCALIFAHAQKAIRKKNVARSFSLPPVAAHFALNAHSLKAHIQLTFINDTTAKKRVQSRNFCYFCHLSKNKHELS